MHISGFLKPEFYRSGMKVYVENITS